MDIHGVCKPPFEAVRQAFADNFSERGEVGARVCVMQHGETVVDLWGGVADLQTGRPWTEDTLVVVMSCTKGAVALCGHILADRGWLDFEAPVARYWPEFARRGKRDILVRHVFSHQSGLVHVQGRVPDDGFCDWQTMIRLIENSAPAFAPGNRTGYHVLTHGYLIGELVRRISGQSIGKFFRREVAEPLGLDFWIGLPQSEERRVARIIPNTPDFQGMPWIVQQIARLPSKLQRELIRLLARKDLTALAMTNLGGFLEHYDSRRYHAAEIPSAGGITHARALAQMYAPLANGGRDGRTQLISEQAIAGMRYPAAVTDTDAFLGGRSSFTLGFSKSWNNGAGINSAGINSVIIGEDAFGTPGFGGNLGFADPACGLSFGYTMNLQGPGTGLNPRGQSLVDAVYRALGSPGRDAGYWVRPGHPAHSRPQTSSQVAA